MRKKHLAAMILAVSAGLGAMARAQDASSSGTVLGTAGPDAASAADAKVDSLLGQMTLDEKISLLGGQPDAFSTAAIEHLGVKKLVMADGPQGVRNYGKACSFPCGAALASTWDVNLATLFGTTIGIEGRARGVNFQLGPGMNLCRVPVNGRNFEYFGEDPVLAGEIAAHWVEGIQSEGVVATIKHFAANNQETDRGDVDAEIDERTLNELYLGAFRNAVQKGGALAVMAAYNRLNGTYCAGNDELLKGYLKNAWGFTGLVMSDWGATHGTDYIAHGLDLEMGTAKFFKPEPIKAALADGKIQQSDIDGAVRRLLSVAIRMHWFDREQKMGDIPLDRPESNQAAQKIAESAVVLLKNDNNVLPLNRTKTNRIAVYGPNADNTPAAGGGSGVVYPFHNVTFLQGIKDAAGANVNVTYVPMPEPDEKVFDKLAFARTSADGPAGLSVRVQHGRSAAEDMGTQQSINLQWKKDGEPQLGVRRNRGATINYTGVLQADKAGDYELYVKSSEARVTTTIDGKRITEGSVFHLDPSQPSKIHIQVRTSDWPPAEMCKVGIAPPMLPDMAPAQGADAVVVCCGFKADSEHEGADRDFDLPASQQQLVAELQKNNPKTVLLINSGAGTGLNSGGDDAAAILQAWYLGQAGGTAVGEILFGDVNPSGRLPDTFDRNLDDNPAMPNYPGKREAGKDYPVEPYREGIYTGYRGYDKSGKDPRWCFGYGLSYTTFSLGNLQLQPSADGGATAQVDVTNTGSRAGAEVVQLYVGQPSSTVDRPLRELKGFAKVTVQPGATEHVTIPLPHDSFAYWNTEKHGWQVDAGTYTVEAGTSERDIAAKASFDVK